MKHQDIISQMTLEEKASLCSGQDFWHLKGVKRLDIPSIMVTDGPHGLRKQAGKGDHVGINGSLPATCFPPAVTTASSWDRNLLRKLGETIGDEARKEQVSVVLGPGVNMKRSPLCGRNFEYMSEDPYLTGELAVEMINGMQSKGIGTSLKHFAANNQESRRMTIDSVVDERTMREIYLPAFESAVKRAQPWTVMNSYNKVNGTYAAENKTLLTDILKKEWGHEGLVVTDWGAENDRVAGLIAGQELEMPASNGITDKKIVRAVKKGKLDEKILDERVDRLLELIFKSQKVLEETWTYDAVAHHEIARNMAAQSAVLLKNEGNILPISKEQPFVLIGDMAKRPRFQGAGSSLINPNKTDNAYDVMKANGIEFTYVQGYQSDTDIVDQGLVNEAVNAARDAALVVLYVGLTDAYESEGFDRQHMCMPFNQNALIEAVAEVNDNVVILLSGGSPVEMPWLNKVKAVLNCYLGGQASGSASTDVLFGDVNPTGKLAETYPVKLEETPSFGNFPGGHLTVEYRESIFMGYRYYDKIQREVLFPFGYGLSYTTFAYSDFAIDRSAMRDNEVLTATVKVKNTGSRVGAEIVQFYVSDPESTIFKAPQELKGFDKVFLAPGEEKTVSVTFCQRSFAYYNVDIKDWHVESGTYHISVGASSRDIRFTAPVEVTSTRPEVAVPDYRKTAPVYYDGDPAKADTAAYEALLGRPIPQAERKKGDVFTLNSTIEDLSETKVGAFIYNFCKKQIRRMSKSDESGLNMMTAVMAQTPIRSLSAMSMGMFTEKMAKSMIMMCSGHFFKGAAGLLAGVPHLLANLKNIL